MYFLLLHNIQRIQYISLSGYRGHTIPATSPPLLLKVKLGHIGFPETLSNIQQVFSNALCVRLNRKWELGIFTKMSTSPLIFLELNYFRLGLAMRLFLLMRIDAHQMRINAHKPHQ